jgi:hypothetical protein
MVNAEVSVEELVEVAPLVPPVKVSVFWKVPLTFPSVMVPDESRSITPVAELVPPVIVSPSVYGPPVTEPWVIVPFTNQILMSAYPATAVVEAPFTVIDPSEAPVTVSLSAYAR